MMNKLLTTLFLSIVLKSYAANYYVNDASVTGDIYCTTIGSNSNSGTNVNSPKATLTNLLSTYGATISAGDTIFIDAGTYYTDINLILPSTQPGISFVGAGYQATIFDNQLAGSATNFFMYINASDTYLSNMSFTGYENNGTQLPGHSGQVLTIGGSSGSPVTNVVIENVSYYNNGASGGNPAISVLSYAEVTLSGGGSYCNSPGTQYTGGVELFGNTNTLNIADYIISKNEKSAFQGGGLRIEGANDSYVNLSNCRISENKALYGGGIAQYGGNLTAVDCILDGNTAGEPTYSFGGGYWCSVGVASFKRCQFINNQSNGNTLYGGAIGVQYTVASSFGGYSNANVTLDSCYFENNSAAKGNDIYTKVSFSHGANVTATDCIYMTTGNYNLYESSGSINTTYFGNTPSNYASAATIGLSANSLYTATPSPPNYTGICGSIVLLPIEFIEFYGECTGKNTVQLDWSTASEYNNDMFIIEKLVTNDHWEEVTRIKGAGTTIDQQNYSVLINEIESSYYRLKQVDFNGEENLFKEIFVENECSTNELNGLCYFIPESNSLIMKNHFNKNELVIIELYNSMGQLLFSSENIVFLDENTLSLTIPKTTPGIYLINATSALNNVSSRVYLND